MVAWIDGGYFWSRTLRDIYKKYHDIEIGYGTYGGAFNLKRVPPGTVFGNYCSTGNNIYILGGNHPKSYFTLHPLFYNPKAGYAQADGLERTRLVVGHDVWIGECAIILPRVRSIGDGAIIGAGSVVTKDVRPYTIVAGNPATVKGVRFPAEVAEKLQRSKWSELDREELVRRKDAFEMCVESGVGEVESD